MENNKPSASISEIHNSFNPQIPPQKNIFPYIYIYKYIYG